MQFAYEPSTGELCVIEMNPRVSRSSALASKATGFPIAKLAALLAVGYTLDELPNDITGQTTAAFEPALDYVAVKAPRFDFAKFPGAEAVLGSEMRAVGEALGLGRTFPEAFLKALAGRETEALTVDPDRRGEPVPERWEALLEAARHELDLPGIHPYWAGELRAIAAAERELAVTGDIPAAKRFGLADARIAELLGLSEAEVRRRRPLPGRLAVDSCAAEFEAHHAVLLPLVRAGRQPGAAFARRHDGRRARQRPEPDRAGHRVRLLLRARRSGAQAARLRGQCSSTRIPRRSRPTTTRPIACTSSR